MKDRDVLDSIARRAHYLATQMIFQANHRTDKDKGDPKIGGHASASASALHILGAIHLVAKGGFDFIANKPHASPADHAYNYLMDLFLKPDFSKLTLAEANTAMMGLRKYSHNGEPVFQSYHSAYDADHHHFFPSGTVGIPPVMAGYLALAYRYCKDHKYEVPDAHFWAISGDSEYREGSMYEAMPDFAEREIGNLTWIVDYNRQSLDGHRITNKRIMNGNDCDRIERTQIANGWEVIQVRHGKLREACFKKPGGAEFKKFLEEVPDYELQTLLLISDPEVFKETLQKEHASLKEFLKSVASSELKSIFLDFGGHDFEILTNALLHSRRIKRQPTLIIAHTIKGWGLKMAAASGNHSSLPNEDEMQALKAAQKITGDQLFERFSATSAEGKFLKKRGDQLYQDLLDEKKLREKNRELFSKKIELAGLPESLDINLKMASYPHTQWMLGQLTAKLVRIANAKPANDFENQWKLPAELFMSMAPDVGTSTNLNPAMDGKIFGAPTVEDLEAEHGVKDTKQPDLVPGEEVSDRFLRFDIAEGNVMSCVGSFGKIRDILGIPLTPLMTVYDFFIKRALDQYFYNQYWRSSFFCVGTPSGVTLSPEGAQHGWKSDLQIPNQITWEPFFCQELDWIFCDALKRHFLYENTDRSGNLIRCVTRGAEQKDFLNYLRKQDRFKSGDAEVKSDAEIFSVIRQEVLSGAYALIHYQGQTDYRPGENVVNIFSMGSPTTEAIQASEKLLAKGIYANVYVVTSPDLLCGILGHANNYEYLKTGLGINSNLILSDLNAQSPADWVTVSGRRIPIVSVHDGEAGLLDNIGSILGVKQFACAVRKHSKCGRPSEIYHYHGIDADAVTATALTALEETAMENTQLASAVLKRLSDQV